MMLEYFQDKYPHLNVITVGLADIVKDTCYKVFKHVGLQSKEYYDAHEDEREKMLPLCGKTPRQIWIQFAEACRAIHPECWIDLMLDEHSQFDVIIVRDMRTESEWNVFSDHECFKIKIDNYRIPDSLDQIDHILDGYPFDFELENNKSKEVLEHKIHKLLKMICKEWFDA